MNGKTAKGREFLRVAPKHFEGPLTPVISVLFDVLEVIPPEHVLFEIYNLQKHEPLKNDKIRKSVITMLSTLLD